MNFDITSRDRFETRIHRFKYKYGKVKGNLLHTYWWVLHNTIAHLGIGLLPFIRATFTFHDYTSDKLNMRVRIKGIDSDD